MNDKELIISLCDYMISSTPPENLKWSWGQGLFVYALLELDKFLKEDRYLNYVKKYLDFHYKKGIIIDSSDTTCPCMASLEVYKITKEEKYKKIVDLGIDYIKNSKKILEGIPNHFGFSKDSTYPASIWVDSLMMFSVFTSNYALEFGDKKLLDYAKGNPLIFAKYLMNKNGLWHHSYWVEDKEPYPKNLFWARGNGWVALSFPLIANNCKNQDELKSIYSKTIDSIIKKQNRDGSLKTILNRFESYKETSATALLSAGIYKAINIGMLNKSYKKFADKAYEYSINKITKNNKGTFLKGISRPTVPKEKIPYTWYMIMPRKSNYTYGVAAMILAYIFKKEGN